MKRTILYTLAPLLFAGPGMRIADAQAAKPGADGLTAAQIIGRMAEVYAGCRSYRDTGWSRMATNKDGHRLSHTSNFTTAFIRPDRFRFLYKGAKGGPMDGRIIWNKGRETLVWCNDCADGKPGTRKEQSVNVAVAKILAGVPPNFIITMLMPERVGGEGPKEIKEPKRLPDEKLGKRDFYRVTGKLGGFPCDLWVEKKTFTVQRIILGQPYGTKEAAIEPLIDPVNLKDQLDLNPPR